VLQKYILYPTKYPQRCFGLGFFDVCSCRIHDLECRASIRPCPCAMSDLKNIFNCDRTASRAKAHLTRSPLLVVTTSVSAQVPQQVTTLPTRSREAAGIGFWLNILDFCLRRRQRYRIKGGNLLTKKHVWNPEVVAVWPLWCDRLGRVRQLRNLERRSEPRSTEPRHTPPYSPVHLDTAQQFTRMQ
jgi:hypothetical protein